MFGFLFLITRFFQGVQEYSPLEFGIRSLPFALAICIAAPTATMLARRIGAKLLRLAGLVLLAAELGMARLVTAAVIALTRALVVALILPNSGGREATAVRGYRAPSESDADLDQDGAPD